MRTLVGLWLALVCLMGCAALGAWVVIVLIIKAERITVARVVGAVLAASLCMSVGVLALMLAVATVPVP